MGRVTQYTGYTGSGRALDRLSWQDRPSVCPPAEAAAERDPLAIFERHAADTRIPGLDTLLGPRRSDVHT
jgi:hypothetical protein